MIFQDFTFDNNDNSISSTLNADTETYGYICTTDRLGILAGEKDKSYSNPIRNVTLNKLKFTNN